MSDRWRGLKALVQDAVEHGSRAVERVHLQTARRPFAVLESLPLVDGPARAAHAIHDATVAATYGAIRLVNRLAGGAVDALLAAADAEAADDAADAADAVDAADAGAPPPPDPGAAGN